METKIKWDEGDGYITATYEGSGNGSASISSDVNEGIDREQSIKVETADKSVSAILIVSQEGLREVFAPSDGDFVLTDGGTFNVLKGRVDETYTRLTYVECTGEQYIDLGYVLKEDDVIDMSYISTSRTSSDKTLFGSHDGTNSVWMALYGDKAYIRFGSSTSTTVTDATSKYNVTIKKEYYTIGTSTETLPYVAMPNQSLSVFALKGKDGVVYNNASCRCMKFTIIDGAGNMVVKLIPCKRDSDGRIGMLDMVSGTFYASASDIELVGGSEVIVADGYELIDYVTFAKDKLYDLGIVKSTYTLDVLFKRNESTSTPYLYALVTSPHTASVTAYLSSGGSWRFGSSYTSAKSNDTEMHLATVSNGKLVFDVTSKTFTKSTFTTPNTVLLGGSREASGNTYKSFQGSVYHFRIYEGDTIVLDWIPCKRISDGVEGFWDCVTQSFISPL